MRRTAFNADQMTLGGVLAMPGVHKVKKPKYRSCESLLSPVFKESGFEVEGELWEFGNQELYLKHPLLKPQKIEFRDYLMKGSEIGLSARSLIILPTGLGKTYLALVNCCYWLSRNPMARILFLAPTVVLTDQHYRLAQQVFIDQVAIGKITGSLPAKKRPPVWQESQIIFATPQTIESELVKKTINLSEICCLVIDEAHLIVKKYSYVNLHKLAEHFGINNLNLTPVPTGKDFSEVEDYRKSLGVPARNVFARSYKSADIAPWVFTRHLRKVVVENYQPELVAEINKSLLIYFQKILDKIVSFSGYQEVAEKFPQAFTWSDHKLSGVISGRLLAIRDSLDKLIDQFPEDKQYKALMFFWSQLVKASIAYDRLNTKGVPELNRYLNRQYNLIQTGESTISNSAFMADPIIKDILALSASVVVINDLSQGQILNDPKVQAIFKLVKKHQDQKIIIFTSLRDSLRKIKQALELNMELGDLNVQVLTGFQENIDDPGMTRKEQTEVCRNFQQQKKGVMLATSVAEAGLNLSVDVAIFYEPILAVRSFINRLGRVARDREGLVYMLVFKGTDEEKKYHIIQAKEKNMKKIIEHLDY